MNKEAIEADIVNIITQNDNKGKSTGTGEIGSKLQNKYPDFDIRTFGYSQLSRFLEDMPGITLMKDNNTMTVSLKEDSGNDSGIQKEIVAIVKSHAPHAIALGTLGQEIRKKHKNFNVKVYGYSQLYKFIDSIPGISVEGDKTDRKVVLKGMK